jgi:hypothetical protein
MMPTTRDAFFREVMAYRPMLRRAVAGILGEAEAEEVFRRLAEMEAVGAYLGDAKVLEDLGAFLKEDGDRLGFYVFTLLDKGTALTVRDSGLIMPLGTHIETRPYFFCGDEAVERSAARVSSYGLEQRYFFPWLAEFGHFLCYCLQERPLMAGLAVLSHALANRGYPIRLLREVEATLNQQGDKTVEEMGRTLGQLTLLNKAMALWWEGELLREMVLLKAGDYLRDKRSNNPYIGQLEAAGREGCLKHIRHWDRAAYHPEPFSRAFAGSFINMNMDRWRFLGTDVRSQKSEVGGQRSEVRGQKSEVREGTEVGGQRSEDRGQGRDRGRRTEVRGQRERTEVRGRISDIGHRISDIGHRTSDIGHRTSDIGNVGGRRSEVGGRRSEDRGRGSEGRDRGQRSEVRDQGYLAGKTVAILGAGSVMGRNLALKAADCGPKKVLLVSHLLNELDSAYEELLIRHPDRVFEAVPVTISDPNYMDYFLKTHAPQIVFHTETCKVLEYCENQPLGTLRDNFVVTAQVAEKAEKAGVERFIFLSTLKAAQPRNYFSVSYRLAELFLEEMAGRSKTRFVSVRVGNLLDEEAFLVSI